MLHVILPVAVVLLLLLVVGVLAVAVGLVVLELTNVGITVSVLEGSLTVCLSILDLS